MTTYFRFPDRGSLSVAEEIAARLPFFRNVISDPKDGHHLWVNDLADAQRFACELMADSRVTFIVSPTPPKPVADYLAR